MPPDREDLHDELLAMLAASREMPPEDEEYLVEPFLDRLEDEHGTRLRRRSPGHISTGAGPRYRMSP